MDEEDKKRIKSIFPYKNIRTQQKKGFGEVLDTCNQNGFVLLEGACGTGKTLLALTPLLRLLETSNFSRIVFATSVKQQQKPIENEIRRINENLDDSDSKYTAVSLVGKGDMCTFVEGGAIDRDDIYRRCDDLRTGVTEISKNTDQDYKELSNQANQANKKEYTDSLSNTNYPFSDKRIPRDRETKSQFCPFYSNYLDKKKEKEGTVNPFKDGDLGLVEPEKILSEASMDGICPYSAMSELTSIADVVICNYYHIFDSRTSSSMMDSLIDNDTLVVFDEAHNIISKTRELMKKRQSVNSLRRTIEEIEDVLTLLEISEKEANEFLDNKWQQKNETKIRETVSKTDIDFENVHEMAKGVKKAHKMRVLHQVKESELEDMKDVMEGLLDVIDELVQGELEDYNKIPLRDTDEIERDKITTWFSLGDKRWKTFTRKEEIFSTVVDTIRKIHVKVLSNEKVPSLSSNKSLSFWKSWQEENHKDFFRCIEVHESKRRMGQFKYEWEQDYRVSLSMNNCLPKSNIFEMIDEFGGGILMSATLEPLDVFKRVTGIDQTDRKVSEISFGLEFPEENRDSMVVDLPKYKYNNRGKPFVEGQPNMNDVRRKYLECIKKFIRNIDGNSMVAMQSYKEAEWVYEMVKKEMNINENNIIFDESSTNKETEKRKQRFFAGSEKVMITGARGTLVEGVDYPDEKLRGVMVCGVPLANTNDPVSEAIITSYKEEFGYDNGFDYSFTIPAVRKARQTIGRAIRSQDDYGVRVIADKRYSDEEMWDGVRQYLSKQEKDEFETVKTSEMEKRINDFF
jgi:DNA excision repair protein ERCC-2